MNGKISHVMRSAGIARVAGHRAHRCHAKGCTRQIPPALFMCADDWRLVPKHLQRAIWKHYQIGQEEGRAAVSREYLVATYVAIKHVARLQGRL